MRSAILSIAGLLLFTLTDCAPSSQGGGETAHGAEKAAQAGNKGMGAPAVPRTGQDNEAIFAGGCFWCMEGPFDELGGVISTTSGYTGGQLVSPSYDQVSSGGTGHAEAIRVVYDPQKVSYDKLLEVFWHNIDPTSANGQFCDRGNQYRSGIFYLNETQRQKAEASKKALETSGKLPGPIVTEVVSAGAFYPAEEYHQDFYKKDPFRYKSYRLGCGRDARLKELWGSAH